VDGGRGLAVQLLVEDGFEQRLEGRRRGVEAEREGAGASMSAASLGSARLEMRDGLGGVEREVCGCGRCESWEECIARAGEERSFRAE
jgi:hypothetical protein